LNRHLLETFPDTWGVDLSPARVEYLTAQGIPNVIVGDAENLEIDAAFNTIVAGELIEHLSNPGSFLVSAARHLAPDGTIVLTTPYSQGLPNVLYAWVKYPRTCWNPEHTMWFCPQTLERLAEVAGLKVRSLQLIEDLAPGRTKRWYWLGRKVYPALRWMLPLRMRANRMIAVLEPAHAAEA
jgi:SAM-dependent methyltransferase